MGAGWGVAAAAWSGAAQFADEGRSIEQEKAGAGICFGLSCSLKLGSSEHPSLRNLVIV